MYFTLTYSGELRANARPQHKHEIRKIFHSQLKTLWYQQPLVDFHKWYDGSDSRLTFCLRREVGHFNFVPLISPDLHVVCDLNIFMLRPEPPGAIITQSGDIDNRLKTLFDALRYPKNVDELPNRVTPDENGKPFYCLLEDDILITSVSVKTDRLLESDASNHQVQLHIQVETKLTQMRVGNRVTGGFSIM